MRWFIADTFFGCEQIIERLGRPFANAEEMDDLMILNWNQAVGEEDQVYHLGNFALNECPKYIDKVLERLNGIKILFAGKYDEDADVMLNAGFHGVFESGFMRLGYHDCFLNHEPLPMSAPKTWCIHGKEHTAWKVLPTERKICMSVDNWNYKPISEEEIRKIMDKTCNPWN